MTIVANQPSSLRFGFLATATHDCLAERTAQVDQLVRQRRERLLFRGGRCCPAGRGRLRPPAAVPVLRYRPAAAVRIRAPGGCASKDAISLFLQRLWDAGLRVSQSVRTPAECLEVHDQQYRAEHQPAGPALPRRRPRALRGARRRLPRFLQANREPLVRNLAQLTRERHAKYAGTFYHLEPNVKETPGGLRDYQLVCWLQQLRDGRRARPSPRRNCRRPSVSSRACAAICTASAAATTTCSPSTRRTPSPNSGSDADAAHWMRDYYRHARAIYRAAIRALEASEAQSSSLFAQFRDWRVAPLQRRFQRAPRARPFPRAAAARTPSPSWCCDLFEFVARHGIRPSLEAEQRSTRACRACAIISRAAAAVARARPHLRPAARAARRPRHARDRRAHRHLPGAGTDRVPGGPRLLPPLHGGRAHPGRACRISGACAPEPCAASAICLPRSKDPAVLLLRAAVSRLRQGHARRRPRGGFARLAQRRHGAHPDAAAGSRDGRCS